MPVCWKTSSSTLAREHSEHHCECQMLPAVAENEPLVLHFLRIRHRCSSRPTARSGHRRANRRRRARRGRPTRRDERGTPGPTVPRSARRNPGAPTPQQAVVVDHGLVVDDRLPGRTLHEIACANVHDVPPRSAGTYRRVGRTREIPAANSVRDGMGGRTATKREDGVETKPAAPTRATGSRQGCWRQP